jgi:hypothetical protein
VTAALLDDLAGAGVRLSLAGDDLRYQTRPGISIDHFRDRIREHKPALVRELRLRKQIIAALDVEPADFDRGLYERLMVLWAALPADPTQNQED